jgi:hypothetical protein
MKPSKRNLDRVQAKAAKKAQGRPELSKYAKKTKPLD